jgi:hypothetical protein
VQKRYQDLVHQSGVQAAFTDLKGAYETNEFVKSNCHQITHVIGRAAVDLYDDIPESYSHGDNFCWSGYYHGAMEAVVAKIGPDKILDEANEICASVSEEQKYSFYHYNCVHGLGHGFMGVLENELFESLETCDTLEDTWEKESCYSGVFMENIMADINPGNKTKYLKADEPLYPCDEVDSEYKTQCYMMQTSHALRKQDDDFGKVFELCGRPRKTTGRCVTRAWGGTPPAKATAIRSRPKRSCMQGGDDEARSNCVIGAVKTSSRTTTAIPRPKSSASPSTEICARRASRRARSTTRPSTSNVVQGPCHARQPGVRLRHHQRSRVLATRVRGTQRRRSCSDPGATPVRARSRSKSWPSTTARTATTATWRSTATCT